MSVTAEVRPAERREIERVAAEEVGLSSGRLERLKAHTRRYVDDGRLAGQITLVARHGRIAYLDAYGLRDKETGAAMEEDTIVRIYSMSKPITTAALMMLYEEGRFQLDDPVSRFIPAFKDLRVYKHSSGGALESTPAKNAMTIKHLLTHTSGLTYGFREPAAIAKLYQERGVLGRGTLADMAQKLSEIPLICEPGSQWNYSVSTDMCGYLVEVISGRPFADFLEERIFRPLDMRDTAFFVPEEKRDRFSANYRIEADGRMVLADSPAKTTYAAPPSLSSGGGGLVSTARDYLRFSQMLLNGGAFDGVRLLGRKTIDFMTKNHLPGNQDLEAFGNPIASETTYEGIGFGLGFAVMMNPANAQVMSSAGEYYWGGAASTAFWVDPAEDLIVIFLTQLMPSSTYPIRRELRVLTYQALAD